MSQPSTPTKIKCMAVVHTPLQLINASEYIFENNIQGSILVIIRNSQWQISVFNSIPTMSLWEKVIEFTWNNNFLIKTRNVPALYLASSIADDIKFRLFVNRLNKKIKGCETLILGNTKNIWQRHLANSIRPCGKIVECEDGTSSLISNWSPNKSWWIRRVISRFNDDTPSLDEIFTAYEDRGIESEKVVQNKYGYIGSLFENEKIKQSDDVWFIGQAWVEKGRISQDMYIQIVSVVRDNYPEHGRFMYYPHPAEKSENVKMLCDALGIERILADTVLEVTLLASDNFPRRLAFLYSSAITTVTKIFNGHIVVDVYRPDIQLFTEKMNTESFNIVYASLEREIKEPNRFFSIDRDGLCVAIR